MPAPNPQHGQHGTFNRTLDPDCNLRLQVCCNAGVYRIGFCTAIAQRCCAVYLSMSTLERRAGDRRAFESLSDCRCHTRLHDGGPAQWRYGKQHRTCLLKRSDASSLSADKALLHVAGERTRGERMQLAAKEQSARQRAKPITPTASCEWV